MSLSVDVSALTEEQRAFVRALVANPDEICHLIGIGVLSEEDIYNGLVGDLIACVQDICEEAGLVVDLPDDDEDEE